ncbi:hypothetical protein RintRC_3706 [Richelia intracellularis]|nr:hypothetical protein RintRC_3706 [Richelia intracellularis]
MALSLGQIAESDSQQDPTFKTSLAYTRLTATSALEKLKEHCSCFFTFYKPIPSNTFLAVNTTVVDFLFIILISDFVLLKQLHSFHIEEAKASGWEINHTHGHWEIRRC